MNDSLILTECISFVDPLGAEWILRENSIQLSKYRHYVIASREFVNNSYFENIFPPLCLITILFFSATEFLWVIMANNFSHKAMFL